MVGSSWAVLDEICRKKKKSKSIIIISSSRTIVLCDETFTLVIKVCGVFLVVATSKINVN